MSNHKSYFELLYEKQAVRESAGKLIAEVLWEPEVKEAACDTELHHIKVWKEGNKIKCEVQKVR